MGRSADVANTCCHPGRAKREPGSIPQRAQWRMGPGPHSAGARLVRSEEFLLYGDATHHAVTFAVVALLPAPANHASQQALANARTRPM